MLHKLVRWGLGIHGFIHLFKTALNIYEKAYYSAILSALSSTIMILGVLIDKQHHK